MGILNTLEPTPDINADESRTTRCVVNTFFQSCIVTDTRYTVTTLITVVVREAFRGDTRRLTLIAAGSGYAFKAFPARKIIVALVAVHVAET